ncbi:ATPase WRNIP1 [Amborella trichopoda]|uniref:UBA domain-containing protein n=1 Tax=Amborella trichopoda TaxID=13333 RepID=U5D3N9_AMBTC|nr:ATPase WRNIP1 [Amborella trichopoda]ERN14978.1 hypothetical protein AMTR_s00032p00220250 [Amborella trichopoda]|eukprot:XP_006853511.1 ATPase WRNIP1 [Amborella trichopoda]
MDQLLNMGFPQDLASQALAATGGKSIVKATEWILNNKSSTPSPPMKPHQQHGRVDHYFHGSSSSPTLRPKNEKTMDPQINTETIEEEAREQESEAEPPLKKLKGSSWNLLAPKDLAKPPASQTRPQLNAPLAERMRPTSIDEVVGQDHLTGKGSILRVTMECDRLPSIILWGPPGTGKTSLARAIARSASHTHHFVSLSAVTAGVKEVRDAVDEARKLRKVQGLRTVLFIDEVHRFSKSQQDSFLPAVEDGSIVLFGATTENPSFHLVTPLLSRCTVLTLKRLEPPHVAILIERAVSDTIRGLVPSLRSLSVSGVHVDAEAIQLLASGCEGDARVALNALENAASSAAVRRQTLTEDPASNSIPFKRFEGGREAVTYTPSFKLAPTASSSDPPATSSDDGDGTSNTISFMKVTIDDVKEAMQCKHLAYDRAGEEHYNLISALHKSMRGGDADASLYWLVRMIEGGEEPLYIARRLVRFASEDVGLADTAALTQAVACYQACHFIGMPECNVCLAQCVAYLALAPKSVAVYEAIGEAQRVVREVGAQNEPVPMHLRNAPTKLMKELGYGEGYVYPPSQSGPTEQEYMPPSMVGRKFLNWPPYG